MAEQKKDQPKQQQPADDKAADARQKADQEAREAGEAGRRGEDDPGPLPHDKPAEPEPTTGH